LQARAQQDAVGMDAIFLLAEPLTVTPENFVVIGRFAHDRGAHRRRFLCLSKVMNPFLG
jgi:hypothetical protein